MNCLLSYNSTKLWVVAGNSSDCFGDSFSLEENFRHHAFIFVREQMAMEH